MTTIPQNPELLKHLFALLEASREVFGQERVYVRATALVLGEIMACARHTVTQLLMVLGLTEADWSAWYRLFSAGRFDAERASEILVAESLAHVAADEVYVVVGDGTQTPRSSRKIEGTGWLRNLRTPPFMVGIHHAQRWFNGSWLVPEEKGYSRAIPLRWMPAFTSKSTRQHYAACKEWEAAVAFLTWLRQQLARLGRPMQQVLMVGDGSYDTLGLWRQLPPGVILLARSAKNRALYHLPGPQTGRGRRRKYGDRAPTPQAFWCLRKGWRHLTLTIRGNPRQLQYRVEGPFLRQGAPDRPLFLVIVRGKKRHRNGRLIRRQPLPFLVNAVQNDQGDWVLPLPVETLLFWAWQRWEIEVCHRELKSSFGLGDKQCFNPQAAVAAVQWSAWVYSLLLLAAYRTWGLCGGPAVPTRWWRGAGRWSFNTLWRSYRAALWGAHAFQPLWSPIPGNWPEKEATVQAMTNAMYGSVRA
jgi:hypothetical protein